MSAPTSQLSVPHAVRLALAENGYRVVSDLEGATASDLAVELGVGIQQAEDVLKQVTGLAAGPSSQAAAPAHQSPARPQRASDLLHAGPGPVFSTLSGALDDLLAHYSPLHTDPHSRNLKGKGRVLGGAVVPGMVVEFSGPPGAGKSAVGLSMALSGALGGAEVLVIDTEGGVTPERISAAAASLLKSLTEPDKGVEDILQKIHVMRVATQVQMVAVLHTLDAWLEAHPVVKLLVIDTLSYHFRQPSMDLSARKRIMDLIKQAVGKAATVRGCAVVATCQMATKFLTADNKNANFETAARAVLMPALGEAWTTERTVQVALFRGRAGDDLRYAHASTTSATGRGNKDPPWASFDIDTSGLPCDIPPPPTDNDP
ncbi:P-loop containing nucleoside triphosphate hydrolase protein [Cutaneotrichosporon oleaginosum]|uniref:p-loop containing nucleoside triphosphate hydrolase protein n=1 Tax=Cutaneotrichosporon oleaginosum TaxID=879819 RepID=A0A0J0XWJ7_9TREE|nr:P-loop containing nucleoside triphosphate hydrolase protein [Cutaneotrichosporon oleaginosum]KLT45440.1 P-loop containing nucleoside triphosphate hydrolase protein [Cutaneotrichosporon oleaginosum]TXT14599.1 hypothetical protein COLE_00792 [Cutaneotrichosporon oleaginosum]